MTNPDHVLSVPQHSHELLAEAVTPLTPDQVGKPSFASEWSIAQVMSHLGSGAEIFTRFLVAGSTSAAPPEQAEFLAIWDRWNAKSPKDQALDGLTADANFLEHVSELDSAQVEAFRVDMFLGTVDLAGFLQMRLGEHALHTWDVRVALDPATTLPKDASELLFSRLGDIAHRTGKSGDSELQVAITTTEPERQFTLTVDANGVRLVEGNLGSATLRLPAEALIRLVYGRLDAPHTPEVEADGVDLDRLRAVFPGF